LQVDLIKIPAFTLTAGNGALSIDFPFPIKLDQGTTITVKSDTNVANIKVTGQVTGFYVDNPNA